MSCRYEIFSHYMVLKISFYSATHHTDRETQRDSSCWDGPYIVPDFLMLMATAVEVFTGAVMDIFFFLFLHFFSLSDAPYLLEGTSALRPNLRKSTQHKAKTYLPSQVRCLWTDMVSVFCLKPPGQTMLGHVLLSLSAFNSQLTALKATAPCSLLNPGAILPPESDYNSLCWDTAVHLPPTDEAGWAARSVSAEARCFLNMQHVGPPLPARTA